MASSALNLHLGEACYAKTKLFIPLRFSKWPRVTKVYRGTYNSCGYTRLLPGVTLWVIALGRDRFGFLVRFIPPVTLQIIT